MTNNMNNHSDSVKSLIEELLNKPNPILSTEVRRKLQKESGITPISFKDKNKLLTDLKLQEEIGYTKLASGGWLIAMVNEMPEITSKMIDWWFWWHPQSSKRYELWYPGEHIAISTKEKYLFKGKYSCFQPCTQYSIERIGNHEVKLTVKYKHPKTYGFNIDLFEENKIATVICGDMGVFKGLVGQSKMTHIFKESNNGLRMISRLWIGENSTSFIQRKFLDKDQIYAIAKHVYIEYKRLGEILPQLYDEYFDEVVRVKIE